MDYDWPGNVRELENYVGRCIINMNFNEQIIKRNNLPHQIIKTESLYNPKKVVNESIETLDDHISRVESEYLQKVLLNLNNNKTETAKKLGISIRNLYYKLDKYNIV